MAKLSLENLQGFDSKITFIQPLGCLKISPWALKLYYSSQDPEIIAEIKENPKLLLETNGIIKTLLNKEIQKYHKKDSPLMGLMIFSEYDYLWNLIQFENCGNNIRVMATDYLANPFHYEGNLIKIKNEFGGINLPNLKLIQYEIEALGKFINSPQKEYDKERYFNDMFKGEIKPFTK